CADIVDGARADDDDQPVVEAVQDAVDRLPGVVDHRGRLLAAGELADQVGRRGQLLDRPDSQVIGGEGHPLALWSFARMYLAIRGSRRISSSLAGASAHS